MGLKIVLCTPWAVRCGIYSYSRKLAEAIANLGHEVYIVRLPRFGRKNAEILRDVAERFPREVDIFVISHEYGLFQGYESIFYETLRSLYPKIPRVTIAHAVGNWDVDGVIAGYSSRVIVHNEFCRRRFGFPNTVVIAHGAEPVDTVSVETAKKALNIAEDVPVVGYLGFISSYKGLEDLFQAMVKVPKAGLMVAGGYHVETETPYMERLKRGADKLLGERVQWRGFIPDEQLATVYAAMSVFVYPSRWATESGALITALSHGRAVIARNLPPFIEKEKQGALTTFKDVADLTKKIKRLLKDEELREKLQKGAKAYAEKTNWNNVAAQHAKLYKEVADSGSVNF